MCQRILAIQTPVGQTVRKESLMERVCALVGLSLLVALQTADQNVLLVQNAALQQLVSIKNVLTHVLEFVE